MLLSLCHVVVIYPQLSIGFSIVEVDTITQLDEFLRVYEIMSRARSNCSSGALSLNHPNLLQIIVNALITFTTQAQQKQPFVQTIVSQSA